MSVELLRQTALFRSLDDAALAALATRTTEVAFDAGAIVVREGEPGDALFVIAEGDAQVYRARRRAPRGVVEHAQLAEA